MQVSFIFWRVVLKEDFGLFGDEIASGGFSGRFDGVLHYVRIRPIHVWFWWEPDHQLLLQLLQVLRPLRLLLNPGT